MSEIQNQDRARTKPDKEVFIYGRGSKVKQRYTGKIFTLLRSVGEFWFVISDCSFEQSLHQDAIDQILINGHWRNFDPKNRSWKKI